MVGSVAIFTMYIMTISSDQIAAQSSFFSPQQEDYKFLDISTGKDTQAELKIDEINVGKQPVDVAVDPERKQSLCS